jgi:hypothetical protein
LFLLLSSFVQANEIPGYTKVLKEVLITVTTLDNKDQQDVFLLKPSSKQPKYLNGFLIYKYYANKSLYILSENFLGE